MHDRREVAEEVAAKLFHAEKAINDAMSAAAQLVALMPQACMRAGLTAAYGQGAVADAVGAINALSEARERIGASHTKLGIIQRHIGIRTLAIGGGAEKPAQARPDLRAVDDDRAA